MAQRSHLLKTKQLGELEFELGLDLETTFEVIVLCCLHTVGLSLHLAGIQFLHDTTEGGVRENSG